MQRVVDSTMLNSFQSGLSRDQWVSFSFTHYRIAVTSYAIRGNRENSSNLRHWSLECSSDGTNWIEIHRRDDDTHFTLPTAIQVFQVFQCVEARSVRLRQLGLNHDDRPGFAITGFELFGALIPAPTVVEKPVTTVVKSTPKPISFVIPSPPAPRNEILRTFSANTPLSGLIDYLIGKHGGNLQDKGVMEVGWSSLLGSDNSCTGKNLVEMSDRYFASSDDPGQFIWFDFKSQRVIPTSYAIRSGPFKAGGSHPKSWKVEVSSNGSDWTELDRIGPSG
jgi:hypothetical protein